MSHEISHATYSLGIYLGKDARLSLNAFLLKDKNTASPDTTAMLTRENVIQNAKEKVEPSTIQYIILSHGCADPCGGLSILLEVAPDAETIGTKVCLGD